MFFHQGIFAFFACILALLALSLKWDVCWRMTFLCLVAYALNQTLLFPAASALQDGLPTLAYPSGLTRLILAAIYGLCSILIEPQRLRAGLGTKTAICVMALFISFQIDRFAYAPVLFNVALAGTVIGARLIAVFSANIHASRIWRLGSLGAMGASAALAVIIANAQPYPKILVVQDRNAWATDDIPYDDKDWTLKAAYSYSLLSELMSHKYDVEKTNHLTWEATMEKDVLFFMTPTKPFSADDKEILDGFLEKGGRVVFIADHTDLYGHARVINSFTMKHGVRVRYDAVFRANDKYAKAVMQSFIFPFVRPMTSSSVSIGMGTAVVAFCHDFISENADYTRPNFFAEMRDTPDDRYGTYPLVTVTNVHGGSIVICSESTIFSNFGLFQPNVLKLLDLTLKDMGFLASISQWSIFILVAVLGCLIAVRRNFLFLIITFILLIIASKSFYFYMDNVLEYYCRENRLVIKSDYKNIYEPSFEEIDDSSTSCSYLFSAIPRLGLYPYFIDKWSLLSDDKVDVFIDECSRADRLGKGQKVLTMTPCRESDSVAAIKENFSDFVLGNWWSQIDVSPFRKNRIDAFVEWIRNDKPVEPYRYPATGREKVSMEARNDRGERRVIEIPLEMLERPIDERYILIEDGIWALKSELDGSVVLVGGDSFNDRRNVGFFSRYWVTKLPAKTEQ